MHGEIRFPTSETKTGSPPANDMPSRADWHSRYVLPRGLPPPWTTSTLGLSLSVAVPPVTRVSASALLSDEVANGRLAERLDSHVLRHHGFAG